MTQNPSPTPLPEPTIPFNRFVITMMFVGWVAFLAGVACGIAALAQDYSREAHKYLATGLILGFFGFALLSFPHVIQEMHYLAARQRRRHLERG